MVSLKPIYLWKYLKLKRNKIPENIRRLFYLSWEDALWDILAKQQVEKGSVILVPEFFCGDVENNIKKHGYKIEYYPVSRNLKTETSELINCLKKYQPKVVVIFHAVGISNQLLAEKDLQYLVEDSILAEDCVHRIIDPQKIKFLKKNHFLIDSLRKVVPLQGCNVYGKKEDLTFSEPPVFQSFPYAFRVTLLWFIMNIFWNLAQFFSSSKPSVFFADKANLIMKQGYDLIGDNQLPVRGFFLFKFLSDFIDIEKINKIKKKQIEFYENNLKNLSKSIFNKVSYSENDKGNLIGYPLVLSLEHADQILAKIRNSGLRLNFELNDNQWSKTQKIIYLPLGPHLTKDNQEKIVYNISSVNID